MFSDNEKASIENWLINSVESMRGNIISLSTDWMQVIEISATKKSPLFFAFATKRTEKERLGIPNRLVNAHIVCQVLKLM